MRAVVKPKPTPSQVDILLSKDIVLTSALSYQSSNAPAIGGFLPGVNAMKMLSMLSTPKGRLFNKHNVLILETEQLYFTRPGDMSTMIYFTQPIKPDEEVGSNIGLIQHWRKGHDVCALVNFKPGVLEEGSSYLGVYRRIHDKGKLPLRFWHLLDEATKASVCKGYKLKIADQYDTDGKKVHIDKPLIVRSMIERGELVASFIIATSIAYNEPVMTYLLHTAFGNSSYGDILISGNQEAYNVDELDGILQGLRLENDRKEEEKRGGKQALRILRGLTGVGEQLEEEEEEAAEEEGPARKRLKTTGEVWPAEWPAKLS